MQNSIKLSPLHITDIECNIRIETVSMSLLYIFKIIKVEVEPDFFKFNFCFHLLRLQTTTILFYAWLGSVYSIQYTHQLNCSNLISCSTIFGHTE